MVSDETLFKHVKQRRLMLESYEYYYTFLPLPDKVKGSISRGWGLAAIIGCYLHVLSFIDHVLFGITLINGKSYVGGFHSLCCKKESWLHITYEYTLYNGSLVPTLHSNWEQHICTLRCIHKQVGVVIDFLCTANCGKNTQKVKVKDQASLPLSKSVSGVVSTLSSDWEWHALRQRQSWSGENVILFNWSGQHQSLTVYTQKYHEIIKWEHWWLFLMIITDW